MVLCVNNSLSGHGHIAASFWPRDSLFVSLDMSTKCFGTVGLKLNCIVVRDLNLTSVVLIIGSAIRNSRLLGKFVTIGIGRF